MGQPRDVEALIADVRRPRGRAKLLAAIQGSEGRYGVSGPSSRTSRTIAKAHRTTPAGDENDWKGAPNPPGWGRERRENPIPCRIDLMSAASLQLSANLRMVASLERAP